jgi:hypothetical protein
MFPELSIERVFRRELDSLPVPDSQLWVPTRRTGRSAFVGAAVAGAAILLVVAAAGLIRDPSALGQPRGVASAPPSLPSVPTCPEPGAHGRCVSLVPNAVRNPAFGYNLVIPGDWREVQMPVGSEPFVRDQSGGDPSLTSPFLLDRHVFTARPAQEWVAPAGNLAPPWDLDVQVWDRQGRTALEWSRAFPCGAPVALGDTNCVQSEETIRGTTVPVTNVLSFRWHVTSYYLERGDQMVILRYMYSEMTPPPLGVLPGVAEDTLKGIVRSIGLV